jgi:hypothetical protein
MTTIAEVRELLNEVIPEGGTEADTLFTDAQVQGWIDGTSDTDSAVVVGWRVKAGIYADLVDTAEGTSKRAMSDLHDHALAQIASYTGGATVVAGGGRTRQHKIVRT